jgi:hypothetical protein
MASTQPSQINDSDDKENLPPQQQKSSKKERKKSSAPRAHWTEERRLFFIDALLEQTRLGRRAQGGWPPEVWKDITNALNKTFNWNLVFGKAKDQYNALRKDYLIVKAMRSLSGWGWDDELKRVTAPKAVFDEHIAAHPEASKFAHLSFIYYDKMHELLEGKVATGDGKFNPLVDNTEPGTTPHLYEAFSNC